MGNGDYRIHAGGADIVFAGKRKKKIVKAITEREESQHSRLGKTYYSCLYLFEKLEKAI